MITLAKNFILIYLLLKPFYIFGSGTMQISDLFLILAAIFFIIHTQVNQTTRRDIRQIIHINRWLLAFVTLTSVVNSIYFVYYKDSTFLLSSIYFIFNAIAVLIFSGFAKDKRFLLRFYNVLKLNIMIQLLIFVTGVGKYYSPDRYMGTLNDPNQFGFFIFISLIFIYIINIVLTKKDHNIFIWIVGILLIIQSSSTGMMLGLAVFLLLQLIYHIKTFTKITYKRIRTAVYTATLALILVVPLYGLVAASSNKSQNQNVNTETEYPILDRLTGKFSDTNSGGDFTILEDRGYDIIYKYPHYILFGAGEGEYERYKAVVHNYGGEIHATLPSILFYYGIVPFVILLCWLYSTVKNADKRILVAYAALFAESFTLINQRQALFWMIIALGGIFSSNYVISKRHAFVSKPTVGLNNSAAKADI